MFLFLLLLRSLETKCSFLVGHLLGGGSVLQAGDGQVSVVVEESSVAEAGGGKLLVDFSRIECIVFVVSLMIWMTIAGDDYQPPLE